MGYTIEQQPNKFVACNSPLVYVVKESDGAITGAAKFRYIVQVQVSTTNTGALATIGKLIPLLFFFSLSYSSSP
jgi:hypothetical protein